MYTPAMLYHWLKDAALRFYPGDGGAPDFCGGIKLLNGEPLKCLYVGDSANLSRLILQGGVPCTATRTERKTMPEGGSE